MKSDELEIERFLHLKSEIPKYPIGPGIVSLVQFAISRGEVSLTRRYNRPMSPQDEQHVKDILRFFFPNEFPPAAISGEVAELAAEMLHEALEGSRAMDLVPRPPGFRPGPLWLVSQAVQMAWRRAGKQRIYETVRRAVALKFRSRYELAKIGI